MPSDFNAKTELELTLRTMTQSKMSTNKSASDMNRSNSRQTSTSIISIFQEDAITDDDKTEENDFRINSPKLIIIY